MSKLNILVVPSWYPPNGGRFFRLQAEALAKQGHKVDVLILEERGITEKVNTKIDASPSTFLNEIRYKMYRIPKWNSFNTSRFISKFRKHLNQYLEKNKPDLIHVHSAIWAGVVVSSLSKEYKIPYVITEHRSLFLEDKWSLPNRYRNMVKGAFQQADAIIAVSSSLKHKLESFTSKPITVIPNMVNTQFFNFQNKIKETKPFTFLSVGNLIRIKGFDILLNAFAGLYKANSSIRLNIVGKGIELENLKAQTKALKIEDAVMFCGYKTKQELSEMFNEVNAFVLSSRKETFGVVIAEAFCCGLPAVVSKCGGPEDIVKQENGYLAEVENAISLQEKMQLMIDNIDTFDAVEISKTAQAIFSERAVAKEIEKVLKNVSAKGH